jgi:hypothetical protein
MTIERRCRLRMRAKRIGKVFSSRFVVLWDHAEWTHPARTMVPPSIAGLDVRDPPMLSLFRHLALPRGCVRDGTSDADTKSRGDALDRLQSTATGALVGWS